MSRYSLDNVTIDGFRGLKNLRLNDLGLINVLVGPNNCGKTSVLEALSILCNAPDPTEWLWVVPAPRLRRAGRDSYPIPAVVLQSVRTTRRPRNDFRRRVQDDLQRAFPADETHGQLQRDRRCADFRSPRRVARQSSFLEEHGISDMVNGPGLDLEPSRGAEITHSFESDVRCLGLVRQFPNPWPFEFGRTIPTSRLALLGGEAGPTETLTPYSYQINRVQVRSQSRLRLRS